MKYICEFYIPNENNEGREYALSACDKASYIHSLLNRLDYDVEIVSPAISKRFSKQRKDYFSDRISVVSGFSLGWFGSISRELARISVMLWLLYYLIFKCKKHETIMIYHGIQNVPIFLLAQKIKGFKYILEVEEIYTDLDFKSRDSWRYKLEQTMIKKAHSYIFASAPLEKLYNTNHKPSVVCSGNYLVPSLISSKKDDGLIHIVYAGSIDKQKVAYKSAHIALYLDHQYFVHILGYGEPSEIDALKNEIAEIQKNTSCHIQYEGVKRGTDYISFLQSCHIGICPLSSNLSFQLACFPSKITSYLSNGLLVATTENEVLKSSSYKNFLLFVKDDSPKAFAEAISTLDVNSHLNPRKCVENEDQRMMDELRIILNI